MRAKSFFYVSLGILALAAAYHVGARNATAQVQGSNPTAALVTSEGAYRYLVFTGTGDVFAASTANGPWTFTSNLFAGSPPVPVQQESLGSLKARYRTPAALRR